MKKLLIILIVILLTIYSAIAQSNLNNDYLGRMISLGFNSDAFSSMELSYAQNPGILKQKNFQIYMRFSFPLLLTIKDRAFDSWEIKAGVRSELFLHNKLGALADFQLFFLHQVQVLGSFIPIGLNFRLTPCYHLAKGYVGFQMGWHQTIVTHISHSHYVKDTFTNLSVFDGIIDIHPKNGWYWDTGSYFTIGIEGAWEMNPKLSLYGDLGIIKFASPYTDMFDAMMMGQVPFYGNVRLFYKF